jgi:hypothetical protein
MAGSTTAEQRSLAKWYAAARAALAHNRPLTTAATPPSARRPAAELSATEVAALEGVGAFKDNGSVGTDNDPLIRTQGEYMALLEESLAASEAAKLLRVARQHTRHVRALTCTGLQAGSIAVGFLLNPSAVGFGACTKLGNPFLGSDELWGAEPWRFAVCSRQPEALCRPPGASPRGL